MRFAPAGPAAELRSHPMPTLGERVQRRDRERFVGRRSELSRFDDLLAGDPVRIVYVTGVGGIGKSTLLREVARRGSSDGYGVVWLDGRDLPRFRPCSTAH